ncbi:MAG: hypothetical protein R2792_07145 [Saprospiraceae bacterium]
MLFTRSKIYSNLLPLILLVGLPGILNAQQPFAKFVIGLEGTFNTQQAQEYTIGPQIEYPWKQFSAGIGISRKQFPWFKVESTDYVLRPINWYGEKTLAYEINSEMKKASYWSVPVKINYRLPCNCVYVHAAAVFDFMNPNLKSKDAYTYYSEQPKNNEEVVTQRGYRKFLRNYEVGLGFKLHANDYFRLIARPVVSWNENPDPYSPNHRYDASIRMTLGVQYAFIRYGGRF